MENHPNLEWSKCGFLSISQQLLPAGIASIQSVILVTSSCFICLLKFGTFRTKYVGLCLNSVMKCQ